MAGLQAWTVKDADGSPAIQNLAFYRHHFKRALAALAEAGVPDVRFHNLRHTAARSGSPLARPVPGQPLARARQHHGDRHHLHPADHDRNVRLLGSYMDATLHDS